MAVAQMAARAGRSRNWRAGRLRITKIWQAFGRPRDRINPARAARNRSPYAQKSGSSMPDWTSLLGCAGGAVLAIYLVQWYKRHYTRSGWLRSGQEASHRLHRA